MDDDNEVVDHYRVLGVHDYASQSTIRKAYLKLSRQWHPDKNLKNPERAQKRFQHVSRAYEILSNEELRKQFDYDVGIDGREALITKKRRRASTADSPYQKIEKMSNMSNAFAKSFGKNPKSSFESAVNEWDFMMNQLLEPVRRRSSKKIQRLWRGYTVRKKYASYLKRQRRKRNALAREKMVLKKAQCRVQLAEKRRSRQQRAKTAPSHINGVEQLHCAKGKLFHRVNPPPIPKRSSKKNDRISTICHKQNKQKVCGKGENIPSSSNVKITKEKSFGFSLKRISAATFLQRSWKKNLRKRRLKKSHKDNVEKLQVSAIHIQRICRGLLARNRIKKAEVRAKKNARKRFVRRITYFVTRLQASVRGWNIRLNIKKKLNNEKIKKTKAVCKIQKIYRLYIEKKNHIAIREAMHIIQCVKRVQSFYRMLQAKKNAAVLKDSFRQKKNALLHLISATKIQSFIRQKIECRQFIHTIKAVIKIQNAFRCAIAQKKRQILLSLQVYRDIQWIESVAEVTFACLDKCRHQKARFQSQIIIASSWRCHMARKMLTKVQWENQQKELRQICLVQSWVRSRSARQKVLNERATQLQRMCKIIIKRTRAAASAQKKKQQLVHCINIQCWSRCIAAKKSVKKFRRMIACVNIQCWFRCISAKLSIKQRRRKTACINVQCWCRSIIARNTAADLQRKLWWKKRSQAAKKIQCIFRKIQFKRLLIQKKWFQHLNQVKGLLKFQDILSSYRAKKWQLEHSVMYSATTSSSSFPCRSIKRRGRSMYSSPNRTRRQQQSKNQSELNSIRLMKNLSIQAGALHYLMHPPQPPRPRPYIQHANTRTINARAHMY